MSNPIIKIILEDEREIKAELYPNIAPISVQNFLKLIDEKFYDGVIFHRVIDRFMIQTGGYYIDGNVLMDKEKAETIKGEFTSNGFENNLKHKLGVLSMARSQDKNSAGSQFFIVTKDSPHLDGQYASFGKVIKGMDVVHKIENVQTDANDKPIKNVVIESIKVDTKGVDYKAPDKVK